MWYKPVSPLSERVNRTLGILYCSLKVTKQKSINHHNVTVLFGNLMHYNDLLGWDIKHNVTYWYHWNERFTPPDKLQRPHCSIQWPHTGQCHKYQSVKQAEPSLRDLTLIEGIRHNYMALYEYLSHFSPNVSVI